MGLQYRNKFAAIIKVLINIAVSLGLYFVMGLSFAFVILWYSNVVMPDSLLIHLVETIGIVSAVIYLFQVYPTSSIPLTLNHRIRKTLFYGLLGGVTLAALHFPYHIVFQGSPIPNSSDISTNSPFLIILFLFLGAVVGPLFEELYFRGCIFRLLKTNLGFTAATAISSTLFAYGHDQNNFDVFFGKFIISLFLTFLYECSGNIISPIIAHSMGNTFWFSAIYLYKYGFI